MLNLIIAEYKKKTMYLEFGVQNQNKRPSFEVPLIKVSQDGLRDTIVNEATCSE